MENRQNGFKPLNCGVKFSFIFSQYFVRKRISLKEFKFFLWVSVYVKWFLFVRFNTNNSHLISTVYGTRSSTVPCFLSFGFYWIFFRSTFISWKLLYFVFHFSCILWLHASVFIRHLISPAAYFFPTLVSEIIFTLTPLRQLVNTQPRH